MLFRSCISGPLLSREEHKLVSDYYYNHEWHFVSLPFDFPNELKALMKSTYMPFIQTNFDQIFWSLTKDGHFSVKSSYQSLIPTNNQHPSYTWIWKLPIPPKISFFLWLLSHNRLPTATYLSRLSIIPSHICT